jgi:hypothetical protein
MSLYELRGGGVGRMNRSTAAHRIKRCSHPGGVTGDERGAKEMYTYGRVLYFVESQWMGHVMKLAKVDIYAYNSVKFSDDCGMPTLMRAAPHHTLLILAHHVSVRALMMDFHNMNDDVMPGDKCAFLPFLSDPVTEILELDEAQVE